jgi:hypothetical protein
VEDADTRASDFNDLADGEWSFVVRAFFTDGRYTPASSALTVAINVPLEQTGVTVDDLAEDLRQSRQEFWAAALSLSEQIEALSQGSVDLQASIYESYQASFTRLQATARDITVDYTNAILAAVGDIDNSALVTAITQLNGSSTGAVADATFQMVVQLDPLDGWSAGISQQVRVDADGTWRSAGSQYLVNADEAAIVWTASKFYWMSDDGGTITNVMSYIDGLLTLQNIVVDGADIKEATIVSAKLCPLRFEVAA